MSPVYDCTTESGRAEGVAKAVEAVRGGEVVVIPTDTVYGIGADAFSEDAVAAVLAARTPAGAHAVRGRAEQGGGYRLLSKDRPYLGLTFANLLVALGYTSLSVLLPVYAIEWLHLPEGLVGRGADDVDVERDDVTAATALDQAQPAPGEPGVHTHHAHTLTPGSDANSRSRA